MEIKGGKYCQYILDIPNELAHFPDYSSSVPIHWLEKGVFHINGWIYRVGNIAEFIAKNEVLAFK